MRLIESNKVIPLVRLILMNHPKADAICENMQKLVDIHTIESEPVKHGRWVDLYGGKYDNHLYECSECKGKALYYYAAGQLLSDYCPHCGAKMDGGAEND